MKIGGSIHRIGKAFALAAPALVSISLVAAEPPANTNFANATILVGDYHELTAPVPPLDPLVSPWFQSREVWWVWTAPSAGRLSFSSGVQAPRPLPTATTLTESWPVPTFDHPQGLSSNEVLIVRSGMRIAGGTWWGSFSERHTPLSPAWGVAVSEVVDSEPSTWVWVEGIDGRKPGLEEAGPVDSIKVVAGRTYAILASVSVFASAPPPLDFSLRFHALPTNDQFTNRTPFKGVEAAVTGNTFAASSEVGEPNGGPDNSYRTVWWTWTAPQAGNLALAFQGNNVRLGIYRGEVLEDLEWIDGWGDEFVLPAKADEPLQFAMIGGDDDLGHDYTLKLRLDPLPPAIVAAKSGPLADGSFQLRAEQLRGRETVLFASTNLTEWNPWRPIWRGVVNGDGVTFRDLDATNSAQVFYSIRLAPPKTDEAP